MKRTYYLREDKLRSFNDIIQLCYGKWKEKAISGVKKHKQTSDETVKSIVGYDSLGSMQCNAFIQAIKDGRICDFYGQYKDQYYHAEMKALRDYWEVFNNDFTAIQSIIISSSPCWKCAAVLEYLDLSDKVVYINGITKGSISVNFSASLDRFYMFLLKTLTADAKISDAEFNKYQYDIFSAFQSANWYHM